MASDSATENQLQIQEVHAKVNNSLEAVGNYLTYREQARVAIALSNEWANKARKSRKEVTELLTGLVIGDIDSKLKDVVVDVSELATDNTGAT